MVHKLSNSPLNRPQCCLNCWSTKQSIRTSKLRPIKFERLIVLRKKKITEPQNTKFECRYECVCVDIPTNKVGWTDKYHQPTTTIYSLECENSTRPLKSLFAEYLAWSRKSCRFFKRVRLFPKAFQGLVLIVRWRKHNKHHLYEFQSESNFKKDEVHARQHHLFSLNKRRGFPWKIAIFQKITKRNSTVDDFFFFGK